MTSGVPIPELETDRLLLRGWRESDFDAFAEMCANPRTQAFIGGVCDGHEAWRRMASMAGHWQLKGYGLWVVEEKGGRPFAGRVGLWSPPAWPEAEIGWALVEGCEGKGYATEAARCAREHAFGSLGWTTAVSYIAPENAASKRVAARLGATRDGSAYLLGKPVEIWRHMRP